MTLACPPLRMHDGQLLNADLNEKLIYLPHSYQTSCLPLQMGVKPILDYFPLIHLFKVTLNFSYLLAYMPNYLTHLLLLHFHIFKLIHSLFSLRIFSFSLSSRTHRLEIILIVFGQQISFLTIVS